MKKHPSKWSLRGNTNSYKMILEQDLAKETKNSQGKEKENNSQWNKIHSTVFCTHQSYNVSLSQFGNGPSHTPLHSPPIGKLFQLCAPQFPIMLAHRTVTKHWIPCIVSWEKHPPPTFVEKSRAQVARSLQNMHSDTATKLKMNGARAVLAASSDKEADYNVGLLEDGNSNCMQRHGGCLWWMATMLTSGPRTFTVRT